MGDPSCTRGAPVGRALPVLGSRGSPPPPPTRPGRRLAPSPPLSSFPAAPGMTHFRGGGRQPAHSRALAPAAPRARSPTGSAVPPGGRRATARPPRPSRGWQRPERCRGRTLPPLPPPPLPRCVVGSALTTAFFNEPFSSTARALLGKRGGTGRRGTLYFLGGPLSPDVRSPLRTGYQHQPAALHCLLWGGLFGGRGCCCSQGCWGGRCQGSERRMAGAPRRAGAEGEALRERLRLMRADRSRSEPLPGLLAAGLSLGVPGVGTGWGTGGSERGSGRFGDGFVAPWQWAPRTVPFPARSLRVGHRFGDGWASLEGRGAGGGQSQMTRAPLPPRHGPCA